MYSFSAVLLNIFLSELSVEIGTYSCLRVFVEVGMTFSYVLIRSYPNAVCIIFNSVNKELKKKYIVLLALYLKRKLFYTHISSRLIHNTLRICIFSASNVSFASEKTFLLDSEKNYTHTTLKFSSPAVRARGSRLSA